MSRAANMIQPQLILAVFTTTKQNYASRHLRLIKRSFQGQPPVFSTALLASDQAACQMRRASIDQTSERLVHAVFST